jgi:Flp pilus assembly protein TadD/outer membrane protein OmpA-like peptidoglycan-associated protein
MRKINKFLFSCLLAALIGTLPILTFAQEEKPAGSTMTHKEKKQLFEKYWFINLFAAGAQQNSDVVINKYLSPISNWRFAYGGGFGWQFHPIWGARIAVSNGELYGKSKENVFWMQSIDPVYARGVFFRARFFEYHLDATVNFSNLISGYNPDRTIDIYGIAGFGFTEFTTSGYIYDENGQSELRYKNGKDIRTVDPLPTPTFKGYGGGILEDWNRKSDINAGLGFAFHIIPQLEANVEFQMKILTGGEDTYIDNQGNERSYHQGDFLDNMDNGTQAIFNDMYSTASIGLTYKFVGGDPLKKMKKNYETVTFKADPDPLEAHGGKVAIKITGTFPPEYFHPKAAMYAEPFLVCEGNKIPLKPILLKGTNVGGEGIVISKDGGSFTYETVVDYDESCRAAELVIEPVIFVPKGDLPANMTREDALGYKKHVELPARKVADGTIVTPERYAFNQTGTIVPHGYVKENILSKNATIFFEVNKYALNWNVPQNKIDANKAKLNEVFEYVTMGYKIKDISIDGWASPEGEETFNQGLSENRTKTANKYVVDKIKGFIKAKDSKLTIKDAEKEVTYNLLHHGPDWNGFITSLQNSDMKDKNSMLNVINSAGTPAMKEQKIREMIAIYPDLDVKLLQPLRRADIVVNSYEPKKTDEEIASLATSNPSALDEKELLYAASMQQDKKAKLEIYKTAIKQFPNSYKGYANAGAIEIELNDLTAAKAHLEKAASLNANSGEVHNNLGIVYALEGDFLKAEEHFTKAGQLGTDASYNLGVISIHKGEYSKALSQFGSKTCDYNVALAYIASKNYPPAEKQLNCAPKDAATHYLMAILGSRTGNTSMLFENLGKAIQMDAKYKAEAKIDREFIKYFNDPNFTSLVQ